MFKYKFHRPSTKGLTDFDPHRAWRVLLVLFLIVTFATLIAGYFLYRRIDSLEEISQSHLREQNAKTENLNTGKLAKFGLWFSGKSGVSPQENPASSTPSES